MGAPKAYRLKRQRGFLPLMRMWTLRCHLLLHWIELGRRALDSRRRIRRRRSSNGIQCKANAALCVNHAKRSGGVSPVRTCCGDPNILRAEHLELDLDISGDILALIQMHLLPALDRLVDTSNRQGIGYGRNWGFLFGAVAAEAAANANLMETDTPTLGRLTHIILRGRKRLDAMLADKAIQARQPVCVRPRNSQRLCSPKPWSRFGVNDTGWDH